MSPRMSVGLDVVKDAAREWVEMDLTGDDPEYDSEIRQQVELIQAATTLDEVIAALNSGSIWGQIDDGELCYGLLSMIVDD